MNSIITSAILGVIMMFSGIFLKKNSSIVALAHTGDSILLLMAALDMSGYHFFPMDTHNMLYFEVFGHYQLYRLWLHPGLFSSQWPRHRSHRIIIPVNILR